MRSILYQVCNSYDNFKDMHALTFLACLKMIKKHTSLIKKRRYVKLLSLMRMSLMLLMIVAMKNTAHTKGAAMCLVLDLIP